MQTTTLEMISEATYNSLWQPSDSTNYNFNSVVKPKINEVINKICKGRVINITNQQVYSAGDLPFLRNDKLLQLIQPVAVEGAFTTISTNITANTEHYNESGKLFVWGDILAYDGKTANTFEDVSDIDIYHNSWEKIYQLYPLPNGISLPFTLFILDWQGNRKEELIYQDYRQWSGLSTYYTIVTHGGSNYLHIYGMSNERLLMIYYINSTNMSLNDDICIIPDDFVLSIIPDIVAGELLRSQEETDDATPKLMKWYGALVEMYSYYSSMIKKNKQTIKLQGMNFSSVVSWYGKRSRTGTR